MTTFFTNRRGPYFAPSDGVGASPAADASGAAPAADAAPAGDGTPAADPAGAADANASAETTEAPKPPKSVLTGTEEEKPEGDKATEEKPAEEKAALTLDDYNADIKLPEGVTRSDGLVDAFLASAVELQIPKDQVQALLDKVAPAVNEKLAAPYKAWNDLKDRWAGEVKADPEFGGANLVQSMTMVRDVLKQHGDPDVMAALDITGAGDHPAIVRTLYRMAKLLSEGGQVAGAPASAQQQPSGIQKMYPSTQRS